MRATLASPSEKSQMSETTWVRYMRAFMPRFLVARFARRHRIGRMFTLLSGPFTCYWRWTAVMMRTVPMIAVVRGVVLDESGWPVFPQGHPQVCLTLLELGGVFSTTRSGRPPDPRSG